jgi:hypothetical protein
MGTVEINDRPNWYEYPIAMNYQIGAPTLILAPYTGRESSLSSQTIVLATSSGSINGNPCALYNLSISLKSFALGSNCGSSGVFVIPSESSLALAGSFLKVQTDLTYPEKRY